MDAVADQYVTAYRRGSRRTPKPGSNKQPE
jgi:hypothetical protein